jgi:hypothetical protein
MTLYELHFVIQCIFGWNHSHLFQFLVTPDGALTRESLLQAVRYDAAPPDELREENTLPADQEIVGRISSEDRRKVIYEYDFGDSWEHIIALERRTPGGDPGFVPICLAGKNAGPGDDMGGIHGYYFWLEAFQDPTNDIIKRPRSDSPAILIRALSTSTKPIACSSRRSTPKAAPPPSKPGSEDELV